MPSSTRRLSSFFITSASSRNLRRAVLPMMAVSTLANPSISTRLTQSSRLFRIAALLPPHCSSPVRLTVLVKSKSMSSFTPGPSTWIRPVLMASAHIYSSRRVQASFRVAYSSISFRAARSAGVMPL